MTGLAVPDALLRLFYSGNLATAADNAVALGIPCVDQVDRISNRPVCEPGVPAGTPVDRFIFSSCVWVHFSSREPVRDGLRAVPQGMLLLGVYRPQEPPFAGIGVEVVPGYAVVFSDPGAGGEPIGARTLFLSQSGELMGGIQCGLTWPPAGEILWPP